MDGGWGQSRSSLWELGVRSGACGVRQTSGALLGRGGEDGRWVGRGRWWESSRGLPHSKGEQGLGGREPVSPTQSSVPTED